MNQQRDQWALMRDSSDGQKVGQRPSQTQRCSIDLAVETDDENFGQAWEGQATRKALSKLHPCGDATALNG